MIKKIIKRTLIGIVSVIVLVSIVISVLYFIDKNKRLKELESNSQLAETSVGTIEYKMYGDEGPVILHTHGTPGGYDQGKVSFFVHKTLCGYENGSQIGGYRVLVPSRPGYLRTPLEVGETPAEQARIFSALLEFLNIEKVIVYGASGGGPSAICFAALYPEKTSALILWGAVSQSFDSNQEALESSDFLAWSFQYLMRNDTLLNAIIKFEIQDSDIRQLILNDPEKKKLLLDLFWSGWPPSKRYPGELNDINQWKSLSLPASNIEAPTIIIHGTDDHAVPVSHSKKLAEQIPGSKLVILEGVDHAGPLYKTEEMVKILSEFLEEVNAGKKEEEEGNL